MQRIRYLFKASFAIILATLLRKRTAIKNHEAAKTRFVNLSSLRQPDFTCFPARNFFIRRKTACSTNKKKSRFFACSHSPESSLTFRSLPLSFVSMLKNLFLFSSIALLSMLWRCCNKKLVHVEFLARREREAVEVCVGVSCKKEVGIKETSRMEC